MLDTLRKACTDTETLTGPQAKDLFKVALACVRHTKRIATDAESTRVTWDPPSWEALSTTLAQSKRFKASTGLHTMCRQVTTLASNEEGGAPVKVMKKRKAEDAMDIDEPAEAAAAKDVIQDATEVAKKPKRKKQKTTKESS
jgi:DNA polymerase phi